MKDTVFNERIAAARQWLEELMQLSFEPVEKEIRRREGLRFLAGFLDDLEILAKDRRQQKEAGHQDQTSFNVLAETATDGIISIDDQSTIRYANPAVARMFGYDLAEILGENLTSLMPERLRGKHLTSLGRYLTSGQRQIDWRRVELVGLHKNGGEFPIEVSFGEVNRNGMHFFTGIIRDVTERKRVEEALRASEQLQIRHGHHAALRADIHAAFLGGAESSLQTMLQSSTEAIVNHLGAAFARIWTLNEQENMLELRASAGQYTRLNGTHARVPVGEQKIGLIAQERKPHLTNDVLNDKRISDPEWAKRERMVAFAGYPLTVERRLVGVLAMFAREALGPDTLEALASVADTIAQGIERKMAEQKLQESEHNLRLFMETIPQMLWSATPDGAIDYWNQRVAEYTGLSADQLQGTGWINAVHPDDREVMLKAWGSAVSEGLPYQFEFRGRRAADGIYRSCVSSALPLRDQAGRILKWYGSVVD
ncbi:MAG: PAS domain S-box protein, partial [Verrucomicrobia bacterium]|nr:PAS domain S-box protein [Verrucomicrobiota bacterium]